MTTWWLRRFLSLSILLILGTGKVLAITLFHPTQLTAYPLNQLMMVGTIDNHQDVWGIVRTPNQQVYRVTIGNKIGTEQAHVVEVTSQRITVQYLLKTGQTAIKTLWLSGN